MKVRTNVDITIPDVHVGDTPEEHAAFLDGLNEEGRMQLFDVELGDVISEDMQFTAAELRTDDGELLL